MTHTDQAADAELVHLFERMCASWTAGDAAGYGACFTEDSDYVSYDGRVPGDGGPWSRTTTGSSAVSSATRRWWGR